MPVGRSAVRVRFIVVWLCLPLLLIWVSNPALSQSPDEATTPGDPTDTVADVDADDAFFDALEAGSSDDEEYEEEFQIGEGDLDGVDRGFEFDANIEELVVIGQKSSELQDITISTTSFNTDDLREMRIKDIAGLARFTPGLEINTAFAASNPTLFIRGIGLKDYNANSAGAVAVYRDGVYLNSPAGQLFQLFDVANVSVLKGAQSGRYGRNATAGVIAMESIKPDGNWSSEGVFTTGSYNAVEMVGAIGFPIVEEKLSGRVAFTYNRRDGYTKNGCAGWDPVANGQEVVSKDAAIQTFSDLNPDATPTTVFNAGGTASEQYLFRNTELAESLGSTGYADSIRTQYRDAGGNQVYAQQNRWFRNSNGDSVCVLESPGDVATFANPTEPGGTYFPKFNRRTLEEFQSLKPYTNNVHDWALRAMFLWEPTVDMEWLLAGHFGQNLSDSRHNQLIAAFSGPCPGRAQGEVCRTEDRTDQFREVYGGFHHDGWSEPRAGERAIPIDGVRPHPLAGRDHALVGADPYLGWYDFDGQELLDVWGTSLNGTWAFDGFTLHSITSYEANDRVVEDEGDASPRNTLLTLWTDRTYQISEDLRAEGGEDTRLAWQGGLYVLWEELEALNQWPGRDSQIWTQTFSQDLISVAPYFNVNYSFIDFDTARPWAHDLNLDVNFRYNFEHKNFALHSEIVAQSNGQQVDVIQADPTSGTWHAPTGDLTLSWMPLSTGDYDLTLHGRYARGWKTGHFNAGLALDPFFGNDDDLAQSLLEPVEPESVHTLEAGFKSNLANNRIFVSAAFFRYWYKDMQVFDLVNEPGAAPTQRLLNADARILGVEMNASFFPLSGLELGNLEIGIGANWLDSTFQDFSVFKRENLGPRRSFRREYDYSGNATIAAPEWTTNGFVLWDISLGAWGTVTPRFDFSFQTQTFLDPQGLDLISQPSYWLFDLRLAYLLPGDRIEIAAWVSNFMDEQFLVDVFDMSQQEDTILQVYGEPRMAGVSISYAF